MCFITITTRSKSQFLRFLEPNPRYVQIFYLCDLTTGIHSVIEKKMKKKEKKERKKWFWEKAYVCMWITGRDEKKEGKKMFTCPMTLHLVLQAIVKHINYLIHMIIVVAILQRLKSTTWPTCTYMYGAVSLGTSTVVIACRSSNSLKRRSYLPPII
ncbi:hypothetical protein P167DRAFT_290087 [Morchella conica CCBAS932]|uniref:Uncharacterized protein n=1 Tax=Morchella conica CCBAS932 TaxID=1392247 RepID=A0A3N4KH37_9PEZI|nr:hypothetical protein P167DRAFT_290087 [Morchella conica CCBAS932]